MVIKVHDKTRIHKSIHIFCWCMPWIQSQPFVAITSHTPSPPRPVHNCHILFSVESISISYVVLDRYPTQSAKLNYLTANLPSSFLYHYLIKWQAVNKLLRRFLRHCIERDKSNGLSAKFGATSSTVHCDDDEWRWIRTASFVHNDEVAVL